MKLLVIYKANEEERLRAAYIGNNIRIRTNKDKKRVERLIGQKKGFTKVEVTNWRIIGTILERYDTR